MQVPFIPTVSCKFKIRIQACAHTLKHRSAQLHLLTFTFEIVSVQITNNITLIYPIHTAASMDCDSAGGARSLVSWQQREAPGLAYKEH